MTATGAALRYQWQRNGLVIPGATAPSHTTLATALADSGAVYAVLVYNGAGLVLSQPAVLTVTPRRWSVPANAGKLAAGPQHTCAIRADGTLACWGHNSSGQIGTGASASWPRRSRCRWPGPSPRWPPGRPAPAPSTGPGT